MANRNINKIVKDAAHKSFAKIDDGTSALPTGRGRTILDNVLNMDAPVMDMGGDIDTGGDIPMPASTSAANTAAVAGATKAIDALGKKKAPADSNDVLYQSQGAMDRIPQVTSSAAPAMPLIANTGATTYDRGGSVNVNDGKHVPAILEKGEYVIPKAKANTMRKQAGYAPIMDEGGDVAPLSTEEDAYRAQGAKANDVIPEVAAPAPKLIPAPAERGTQSEAQPMRSDVQQDLIPEQKGTPEERKAIDTDRKQAMGKGPAGILDLGLADLHEQHLQPQPIDASMQLGNRPAPAYAPIALAPNPGDMAQTKAGGALIPQAAANETPGERSDFASMQRKGTLAAYDTKIQAARDAGDETTADKLALAKNAYIQSTPWGSPSNHPGFGGKFAHIMSDIGQGAAHILSPGLLSAIPGTQENRAAREAGGYARITQDTENDLKAAQTQAEKDKETATPSWKEVTGGAIDPKHPELGMQQAFYNEKDPTKISFAGAVPVKEGAEKDKPLTAQQIADYNAGFAQRWKVLNPTAPVPANNQLRAGATAADFERNDKLMQQTEVANGTKAQQDQTRAIQKQTFDAHQADLAERQQERADIRGGKLVNYRDKNGDLVSGTRDEADAAGVQSKDIHGETSAPLQEKSRQAYTQYGRILENTQAAMDTMPAWNNEVDRKAAMDVSKQFWSDLDAHVSISPFEVGAGGGVGINPEYRQQAINSDAYRKMSPQGQAHMQNMFQLWSDAINIVKQETGGVPRGQVFLQREDAILPHPDKTPAMNEKALQNLAKRIRTDAKEFARPSDIEPLGGVIPNGAHSVAGKDGRTIGYATFEQKLKGTYTAW
jgi:hypothetical protein